MGLEIWGYAAKCSDIQYILIYGYTIFYCCTCLVCILRGCDKSEHTLSQIPTQKDFSNGLCWLSFFKFYQICFTRFGIGRKSSLHLRKDQSNPKCKMLNCHSVTINTLQFKLHAAVAGCVNSCLVTVNN